MLPIDPPCNARITPGTCVRLRREALGLSRENVALMLETTPAVSTQRRVEWLAALENDAVEISLPTAWALQEVIGLDLRTLSYWMAVAQEATKSAAVTVEVTEYSGRRTFRAGGQADGD